MCFMLHVHSFDVHNIRLHVFAYPCKFGIALFMSLKSIDLVVCVRNLIYCCPHPPGIAQCYLISRILSISLSMLIVWM